MPAVLRLALSLVTLGAALGAGSRPRTLVVSTALTLGPGVVRPAGDIRLMPGATLSLVAGTHVEMPAGAGIDIDNSFVGVMLAVLAATGVRTTRHGG